MDVTRPERSQARHRRLWRTSHSLLWARSQRRVPCSTAKHFIRADTDLRRDWPRWLCTGQARNSTSQPGPRPS